MTGIIIFIVASNLVICGTVCALIAKEQHRSKASAFVVGALFGIFALIYYVAVGKKNVSEKEIQKEPSKEEKKKKRSTAYSGCLIVFLIILGVFFIAIINSKEWKEIWKKDTQNIEEQMPTLQDIQMQVAADAMEQYKIAKKHGSAIDACVSAGLVSAALLQAKQESLYQQWKQIENQDCARAGLPR